MTPEISAKVNLWRQKCIADTMTQEEMKEAVAYLKGERRAAADHTSAAKRSKAIKAVPTAEDLLKELDGL